MEDAQHEELLSAAVRRFPVESFCALRRSGIAPQQALDVLGFERVELTFVEQALLQIEPWNEQSAQALLRR